MAEKKARRRCEHCGATVKLWRTNRFPFDQKTLHYDYDTLLGEHMLCSDCIKIADSSENPDWQPTYPDPDALMERSPLLLRATLFLAIGLVLYLVSRWFSP